MEKTVKVVGYYEETITGTRERCVDDGYLIAPDIVVMPDRNTLYFIRVKPSTEGAGLYEDIGLITDVIIPPDSTADIRNMPPETLNFALWAAGSAVAV